MRKRKKRKKCLFFTSAKPRRKKYHNSLFWNSLGSQGTYFPYYHLRPLNHTDILKNPPSSKILFSENFLCKERVVKKVFLLLPKKTDHQTSIILNLWNLNCHYIKQISLERTFYLMMLVLNIFWNFISFFQVCENNAI